MMSAVGEGEAMRTYEHDRSSQNGYSSTEFIHSTLNLHLTTLPRNCKLPASPPKTRLTRFLTPRGPWVWQRTVLLH